MCDFKIYSEYKNRPVRIMSPCVSIKSDAHCRFGSSEDDTCICACWYEAYWDIDDRLMIDIEK